MMSITVEHYDEKTGNRDGGALAQQRRMIWGLLIWSTLLTLGLAVSIALQFGYTTLPRESPAKPETDHRGLMTQDRSWGQTQKCNCTNHRSPEDLKGTIDHLITFDPEWGHTVEVEQLNWKTNTPGFISKDLTVQEDGLYFLYLQVTLDSPKVDKTYEVTVKSGNERQFSSNITSSKPSTGLMGKGMSLGKGEHLTVICSPKAQIKNDRADTYLGVIKIV